MPLCLMIQLSAQILASSADCHAMQLLFSLGARCVLNLSASWDGRFKKKKKIFQDHHFTSL